jgi:error-prone DNA polymerase
MSRTGLLREALERLVSAGAFDSLVPDRRAALWQVGLLYRPVGAQQALPLPVAQDMADLAPMSGWEEMLVEYRTMGLHPSGHLMAYMRPRLDPEVLPSSRILTLEDGARVTTAGLVIRRQHPGSTDTVFITLEDEFGHTPLMMRPAVFQRYRLVIKEPVLKVHGVVSRREGTMNIEVEHAEGISASYALPPSKNWG